MAERPLPEDDRLPSAEDVAAAGQVNPRVLAARRSTVVDELVAGWPQSAERGA